MCYFIRIRVQPEGKPERARQACLELAAAQRIALVGEFPEYALVSGGCSCDYVEHEGRSIQVSGFIAELAGRPDVKYVRVTWGWGDNWTVDQPEERLAAAEFQARNSAAALQADTTYRVNEPRKYNRSPGA